MKRSRRLNKRWRNKASKNEIWSYDRQGTRAKGKSYDLPHRNLKPIDLADIDYEPIRLGEIDFD